MTSRTPGAIERGIEAYARELSRALRWVDSKKRKAIVQEARAHLEDSIQDKVQGGMGADEAISNAIEDYGSPKELAVEFVGIYGVGTRITMIFVIISFLLAATTVPFDFIPNLPMFTYAISILLVYYCGLSFGTKAGIAASLAAIGGRFVTLGVVFLLLKDLYSVDLRGIVLFVIASFVYIAAAYIGSLRFPAARGD